MSGDGTETVPLPEPHGYLRGHPGAQPWVVKSKKQIGSLPVAPAIYTRAQVEQYGRECAKAGAEGERAAVVAHLREQHPASRAHPYDSADAIERGDHL